jgi:hypothetical protein
VEDFLVQGVKLLEKKGQALAFLILGLSAIVVWLIPLIGVSVTIVVLVMGILGRNSSKKGMTTAGIILSVIFLLASITNAIAGVILYMNMTN